jgi:type II secretory pathway pseudopilin PulG
MNALKRNTIYERACGVTAVEMLVGMSILAVMFTAVSFSIMQFINTGRNVAERTQALFLAEEAIEMVRYIRDAEWEHIEELNDGTTYYLAVTGGTIGTTTVPEVIGEYTRSFVIESVERNANDDIVVSGTPDPSSKYVTATVSWGNPLESVSLTSIIADINNP